MTIKADEHTRVCEAIAASTGEQCRAKALRDSDPPRCLAHSRSEEERKQHSEKMARRSAWVRKSRADELPVRDGLAPSVTLADVLEVCRPALTAKLPTGEADWSARLAAAGTLLMSFPRSMRDTPEKVRELLEQVLPSQADELHKRVTSTNVYKAMRDEWDRLRVRHHPLTGLYVEPYPGYMFAPSEDRAAIRASQPKPTGWLERTSEGKLVLYREGEQPLLIEEDYAA